MSSRYAATHQTPAGSDLPIINLTGGTTVRCKVYELIVSYSGTPADAAALFVMELTTTAGVGGTVLAETPLDPLTDTAIGAAVGGTFSTKPADAAELMQFALNQRATFRWCASPDGELITVAASAEGIMLNCESVSTGTPNVDATIHWLE